MSKIADLIKRMKTDRNNLVSGGTPAEAIRELESELGCSLPPSYAEFLRAFDGGEFGFARMHAITKEGAGFFDFRVELRRFFANNPWMGVRNVLPFACSYGGDMFCFDLAHAVKGEPPVLFYDHELKDDQELEHRADSFTEWVAAYYKECDTEPHRVTVYLASAADLEPFAGDDVTLDSAAGEDSLAKRVHMSNIPGQVCWALDFDEPKQIPVFLDRALKVIEHPIELIVFDDMEMNSDPKWSAAFASITVLGKKYDLKAGDHLRFHPDGVVENLPPRRMANHVVQTEPGQLTCSFCSAPQDAVKKLIAGPTCYICNNCVELCNDILEEELFPQ